MAVGAAGGAGRPGGRQVRELCARAERLHEAARALLADHARAREAVRGAVRPLRDELVDRELAAIPVARLKDATGGRLRLAALEEAGFDSVGRVHAAGRCELRQVPGVGAQTADQALAAARQIARAVGETVAVRIDVDHPRPRTTALVTALHKLVGAGPQLSRAVGAAQRLDTALAALLPAAQPAASRLRMLLAGRGKRAGALAAVADLRALTERTAERGLPLLLAQVGADLLREPASEVEAWVDFELRSAEYYSLLAETDEAPGDGGDLAAAQGFLPLEVAERVRAQALDDTHCRVSLRGYQAFGARFALVQRRVILGDEMGLGKTVQAIAALAHLAAGGHRHFLVVCPASVLINWTREITSRSALKAVPVHGPERHDAYAEWRTGGGVAITTFDVLHALAVPDVPDVSEAPDAPLAAAVCAGADTVAGRPAPGAAPQAERPADPVPLPALLVVDEAHYVKNPQTRRSRAVAAWAGRCERVLFLTGTPMENRVEEFRSLVRHLGPELLPGFEGRSAAAGSQAFRRAVAPAYLRRNQQDVLTELPALLHVDEWEELGAADREAYRAAVEAGNFMAMRRAAYAHPATSAKLQRLCELVADAAGNGLKAVVFSYFREVLSTVRLALESGRGRDDRCSGPVFGPVSGEMHAARRQRTVDDFGAVEGHAVLLCQIEAGGVGLNLQAASVVILCEPQVKPTLEHQAVARAHRMGQVRTVRVHRLLAAGSVDERMLAALEDKARLFDAYARRSDMAEATPDAVDISDGTLVRHIVEDEQRRLAVRTACAAARAGSGEAGPPAP
ncbi:helicase SNF2 [Streptomyces sulfonofaciens]|uniref:Helicase SNF2 n=1 Tax=Streptomyces sulfonofaciens TaxID=68272 RepID=A0A919GC48_9ACTN|nr:DEAD/DEAH box helicase [Streptomyces sulfonofaciens]GHH81301.1 helicase SNF2 [Streptomyces sulfonofaciens]